MVKCHTLSNITKLDDLILESYPSREARGLCCPYSYHRKPSTVYYTPLPMSSKKSTQAGVSNILKHQELRGVLRRRSLKDSMIR